MKNPFVYGKRMSGQGVFDRDKVKADILNVFDDDNTSLPKESLLHTGDRRALLKLLNREVLADGVRDWSVRNDGGGF